MAEIKKVTLRNGKARYRFVIDIGRDADGRRKQLTCTYDTKAEAQKERARILHQREAGTLIVPDKTTVSEWLDVWLAKKAKTREETTINTFRNYCTHVHEQLGHIPVQQLTEEQVERFRDYLLTSGRKRGGKPGTGLAYITVQGVINRLQEALDYAVARKLIAVNVARFVEMPSSARHAERQSGKKREAPWKFAEVERFVAGIEGDRHEAPLLLALMGLRPAEVCGLRWEEHVDLDARTVEVGQTRTLMSRKGLPEQVIEKGVKTEAGNRCLPLPDLAFGALAAAKVVQDAERLTAADGYVDSGFVFVDELGNALTTRHLRLHAYKLMSQLGLRRVRLYDARHSCLSYLALKAKVPDVVLAAWAGHANVSVTKKHYVHVSPEDLHEVADALGSGLMTRRSAGGDTTPV
ncbi:tyrosine recombinase XerC [Streptomyces massasporeus]